MPGYNKSALAFEDVKEILERAHNSYSDGRGGIKIRCANRGAAVTLRSRLNYFRQLNRKDNAKIYPADHVMHKASIYDYMVIRIGKTGEPDEHVLYLQPRLASNVEIEDLIVEEAPEK